MYANIQCEDANDDDVENDIGKDNNSPLDEIVTVAVEKDCFEESSDSNSDPKAVDKYLEYNGSGVCDPMSTCEGPTSRS